MRYLLVPLLVVGCSGSTESRGTTAKAYGGTIPVLFINATPEKVCGLYLSFDNEPDYGDNWLAEGGLDVGKEIELKVKPGTYKAKWNTCADVRDVGSKNYSATLVGGTAFPISEPMQLYAFVSDGTPPTKRGVPKPRMTMVKFIGQTTEIVAAPATEPPKPDAPAEPAPAAVEATAATNFVPPIRSVIVAPLPKPVAPIAPKPAIAAPVIAPRPVAPPPPIVAPPPVVPAPPPSGLWPPGGGPK